MITASFFSLLSQLLPSDTASADNSSVPMDVVSDSNGTANGSATSEGSGAGTVSVEITLMPLGVIRRVLHSLNVIDWSLFA
jgi:hypothetical protein